MKKPQDLKSVDEMAPIHESYRATNGDPAPLFQASAFIDHTIKPINLEDYFGKWIVLFFYPSDFTFV